MSKYSMYYTTRQNMYRDFATTWANAVDSSGLPEYQKEGMALFFRPIARRFGLIGEFRAIGVIK
jgi:hypothetical protein